MNLRGVAVLLYLLWFCVFFLPVHFVLWLIGKKNPAKRYAIGRKLVKWGFACEFFIGGVKVSTSGKENIPDTPCLFVSNHSSYWDILVMHNAVDRPMGFVAKVEMAKYPLLNLYMKDIGCLFLDRENAREGLKTMKEGAEYLKSGHSMMIFPEGTRSKSSNINTFKEGALKMAEKANVPVVPVAIIGSAARLEANKKGWYFKPGKVHVAFGEPFMMSDLSKEDKKRSCAYTQEIVQGLTDQYRYMTE